MSAIVSYEPFVDEVIDTFLEQLETRFVGKDGPDAVVDLAVWLQYYAFDTIGELTYSTRHGFIQCGGDIDGIISYLSVFMHYSTKVGNVYRDMIRLLLHNF
jgi:hypothetical protein